PVPIGAEGEHGLDRVPSVGQLAPDVQREIELRRRDLPGGSAQGAALAAVRPLASFAFTRVAISSSAVTSDAFQAKRASYRRPDRYKASPRCSWISACDGSFSAARCKVAIASGILPRLNC